MKQLAQVHAAQLVRIVPQQVAAGDVRLHDKALWVDHPDQVRRGLDHGPVLFLALAQGLAHLLVLRDVVGNAADPVRPAELVAERKLGGQEMTGLTLDGD